MAANLDYVTWYVKCNVAAFLQLGKDDCFLFIRCHRFKRRYVVRGWRGKRSDLRERVIFDIVRFWSC